MINEVEQLSIAFEKMEEIGKVDLDCSLPVIEKLAKKLKFLRDNLVSSELSSEEIFKNYYPSFVISVVLQNIKDRLKNSEIMKDNPIIAINSLNVISAIKPILSRFETGINTDIMNLANNLQISAKKNGLFNIDYSRLKTADDVLRDIISHQ
jgi:hypothetical protein